MVGANEMRSQWILFLAFIILRLDRFDIQVIKIENILIQR